MSLSSIGMSELLIILVIVLLLFGTRRLKTLGSDVGGAIRGFRRAMEGQEANEPAARPMIEDRGEAAPIAGTDTTRRPVPGPGRH